MIDENKKVGAGAGSLAPGDPGGAALDAAQALVAAYDPACTVPLQTGTAFYNAVRNFKVAYNIWTSGSTDGPNADGSPCDGCLAHNGLYDQACVDAINGIPGAPAAPAACTAAGPVPTPPTPPPTPPVAPSGGLPTWAKVLIWVLIAGGAVAAGIWLFRYFGKKNTGAAEKRRPRRRARRKGKKR